MMRFMLDNARLEKVSSINKNIRGLQTGDLDEVERVTGTLYAEELRSDMTEPPPLVNEQPRP